MLEKKNVMTNYIRPFQQSNLNWKTKPSLPMEPNEDIMATMESVARALNITLRKDDILNLY